MALQKQEVRERILDFMKELMYSELNEDEDVPDEVAQFLLQNYEANNVAVTINSGSSDDLSDCMEEFVFKLEKLIEKRDRTSLQLQRPQKSHDISLFLKSHEKFKVSKVEWYNTMASVISLLDNLVKQKEELSSRLKKKSMHGKQEVAILESKCRLLLLNSLYKMYTEKGAYKAHLALRQLLKSWKNDTDISLSYKVQQEKYYSNMHDNKDYLKLLKTYKKLQEEGRKIDYVIL